MNQSIGIWLGENFPKRKQRSLLLLSLLTVISHLSSCQNKKRTSKQHGQSYASALAGRYVLVSSQRGKACLHFSESTRYQKSASAGCQMKYKTFQSTKVHTLNGECDMVVNGQQFHVSCQNSGHSCLASQPHITQGTNITTIGATLPQELRDAKDPTNIYVKMVSEDCDELVVEDNPEYTGSLGGNGGDMITHSEIKGQKLLVKNGRKVTCVDLDDAPKCTLMQKNTNSWTSEAKLGEGTCSLKSQGTSFALTCRDGSSSCFESGGDKTLMESQSIRFERDGEETTTDFDTYVASKSKYVKIVEGSASCDGLLESVAPND